MPSKRVRSAEPAAQRQHRLSMSEIVQQLLVANSHRGGDHSSVKIARNAKGDVQIEVSVRTGENGVETVDEASSTAQEIFNHLEHVYPPPAP